MDGAVQNGLEAGSAPDSSVVPGWMELAQTVILSSAVILAAWSAYQASLWGGVQSAQAGQYTAQLTRWSDVTTLLAGQAENDLQMMSAWLAMASTGNEEGMRLLEDRFAPGLKPAFDVWIAQASDGGVPAGLPQDLPEYLEGNEEALELRSQLFVRANEAAVNAADANETGDKYVLMTVVTASIMFFAGVGTKLGNRRLRNTMLVSAGVLLGLGAVVVLSFPRQPISF